MIGCNVCPDEKWEKGRVDCSVKDERMENKMPQFPFHLLIVFLGVEGVWGMLNSI